MPACGFDFAKRLHISFAFQLPQVSASHTTKPKYPSMRSPSYPLFTAARFHVKILSQVVLSCFLFKSEVHIMAEVLSASEIADLQVERLKSSTGRIRTGIERVQEAPGMKAGRQQEKLLQNFTEAVSSGKWRQRVEAVPLEQWKSDAINKGLPRISAGIEQAKPKIAEFHRQRQAHQGGIDGELDSMASTTLQDNINRMVHQVTRMADFTFER